MSLTLHYHPLSSFCQKVLVGLYEADVAFEKNIVDLADPDARAALARLWPMVKFPVLRDEAKDCTIAESSIILEYLDQHPATRARLVPSDPARARECRFRDRFFDLHVSVPMQKIVGDKLRPEGRTDAFGVAQAKSQLEAAYALADTRLCAGKWAMGEDFSMADCAAAPALFYAQQVLPLSASQHRLAAYYERLTRRPSVARVLEEMKPYWALFPG